MSDPTWRNVAAPIIDPATRWRDDLAERIGLMESEGVPDAESKARADCEACRRRDEQVQVSLFEEAM